MWRLCVCYDDDVATSSFHSLLLPLDQYCDTDLQRARSFAEGVLKPTSVSFSDVAGESSSLSSLSPSASSSPAATMTSAIHESLTMLCRTLGIQEPQSVAKAARSMHFTDTSVDAAPQFAASDVRDSGHIMMNVNIASHCADDDLRQCFFALF